MAKQKAKLKSKAKSAAKSAPKPQPTSKPKLVSKSARGKPARKPDVSRPGGDDRHRQSARRHRARNDQYASARGALGGDFERTRLLLLHPHRRQSASRLGRRVA